MASIANKMRIDEAPGFAPVVVVSSVPACGECRYHMPRATDPSRWCTCGGSIRYADPVTVGQPACVDFVPWPEGATAPYFLDAMGF